MEIIDPQLLAAQLRKPEGDFGLKVAQNLNETNQYITRFTYACARIGSNSKLLELGFGNGKLMQELADEHPTMKLYGIDFSEDMVNVAKEINKHYIEKGQMELQTASASAIPYPDNYFDAICTINTLYFWESPLHDAQELLRVLKPKGQLCIGIRMKEEVEQLPFTAFGFRLYTIEEVESLLQKAGFSIVNHYIQHDPEFEFQGQVFNMKSLVVEGIKAG